VVGTDHGLFDRVVGELESALPQVFALHAVLPEPKEKTVLGPPEFTATLSPEGLVQLRGRLSDENLRRVAVSYARARFGTESVHAAARVVEGMPADWPIRVLAGIESLAQLVNGIVTVTPDSLTVTGVSDHEDAASDIARLLADKLGAGETFDLSITYRAPPKPENASADPEICEARLADAQRDDKITFEPGSARIAAESLDILNRIVDILTECREIRMEIQGHTDSQGREEMNQKLSQARAESVLNELRARRVLTSSYAAVGYGEALPIADNDTEDGREANRRIEFRLIRAEPPLPEPDTTIERAEAEAQAADPDGAQIDATDDIPSDPAQTAPETDQ
jgi:OOP family OmpA-OmpF porin